MSSILIHFAVGVACTLAPLAAVLSVSRRPMRTLPIWATLGGCWATIPSIVHAASESRIGWVALLLGNEAALFLTTDLANLFFFHRSIRLKPIDMTLPALLLLVAVYGTFGVHGYLRHRQIVRGRRKRRAITAHDTPPFTPVETLPSPLPLPDAEPSRPPEPESESPATHRRAA